MGKYILHKKKIIFLSLIAIGICNIAQAKYEYSFPKDHYAHTPYQLEWWYYTGHIKTNNNEYGYQLTFFKVEIINKQINKFKEWKTKPILIAHFAVSDKVNEKFYYSEKINRPIGKIAGINKNHIWNENFSLIIDDNTHYLKAKMKNFEIDLSLKNLKPPLIHGNGISKKGKEKDNFSYYYSITRLENSGYITVNGKKEKVKGISWMDHEWMNNRKYFDAKWDWFSLQLSNNTEIMFYVIRDKNNNIKPVSGGSIILSSNKKENIKLDNIKIDVLEHWISPKSKAKYPIEWKININTMQNISLHIVPYFKNQELITKKSTRVTYWEGAVLVKGKMNNEDINGMGYIEMTGYDVPQHFN